eukprot:6705-Pelagomonas_calceolata.AAC.2
MNIFFSYGFHTLDQFTTTAAICCWRLAGVHSPSATKDVKYGGAIGQMHEGGAWLGAQPPSAESGGCGGGSGGRGTMGGLRRGGSNICDSTFSGGLSKRDLPGHAFSASRAGAEKDEEEIEEEEGVDEEEDEEDVDEGVDEILAQYYGARAGAGRGALSSSGGVGRPGLAYVGSGGSDAQVSPANSQYDRWAGMVGGSRGSHGSGDMEVGGGGFRGLSNVAGQDVGPTNEVVHTKRGGAGGRCGREQGPQPPSASLLRAVADGAAPMRGCAGKGFWVGASVCVCANEKVCTICWQRVQAFLSNEGIACPKAMLIKPPVSIRIAALLAAACCGIGVT